MEKNQEQREKMTLKPEELEVEGLEMEDLEEVSGGTGGSAGCPATYSCGCHIGNDLVDG